MVYIKLKSSLLILLDKLKSIGVKRYIKKIKIIYLKNKCK